MGFKFTVTPGIKLVQNWYTVKMLHGSTAQGNHPPTNETFGERGRS